jgi:hypothetical protein
VEVEEPFNARIPSVRRLWSSGWCDRFDRRSGLNGWLSCVIRVCRNQIGLPVTDSILRIPARWRDGRTAGVGIPIGRLVARKIDLLLTAVAAHWLRSVVIRLLITEVAVLSAAIAVIATPAVIRIRRLLPTLIIPLLTAVVSLSTAPVSRFRVCATNGETHNGNQ